MHAEADILDGQTLIIAVHAALRIGRLHPEWIEAIGHYTQLAVSRPIRGAGEHWRCYKSVRIAIVRGALDRMEELRLDRALERRFGLEELSEPDGRVANDALQRRKKFPGIRVRQQSNVDVRRCLGWDDVGFVRAVEPCERDGIAKNRVPIHV